MRLGDKSDFTIFAGIILMLFGIYILIFYFDVSRGLGLVFLIIGAVSIVSRQCMCYIDKKKRGVR